jgi:hypothetical protein
VVLVLLTTSVLLHQHTLVIVQQSKTASDQYFKQKKDETGQSTPVIQQNFCIDSTTQLEFVSQDRKFDLYRSDLDHEFRKFSDQEMASPSWLTNSWLSWLPMQFLSPAFHATQTPVTLIVIDKLQKVGDLVCLPVPKFTF